MDIRSEKQLNPVADETSAITAVVRPILYGIIYALKEEAATDAGGRETMLLRQLARNRRPGDGDCGICFEYAVHDALQRQESAVTERVVDALKLCRVDSPDELGSILFGVEKAGAQDLIDTTSSLLTDESSLLSGTRGRPVKLKRHLTGIASAFRKETARANLPQSISGIWRADLFLGSSTSDRWVGTTVKINPVSLKGDRGLRVGVVPSHEGVSDAVRLDERRNLVVCPVPYDGSFMEVFYKGWEVVQQFLLADARLPKEVDLPRPAAREVARYLADRRDFPVLDVIEALGKIAQPELLATEEEQVSVTALRGSSSSRDTTAVVAPQPTLG